MKATETIRARIQALRPVLEKYPGLWEMYSHCFMNTLETTVQATEGDTFVITGDIPAMWLRDSTAQVMHYIRFADDPDVAAALEGLIARQSANILRDPYANAFNREENEYKPYPDRPRPSDWVWERKYEVDSLCNAVRLARRYYDATGSKAFLTEEFHEAIRTVTQVFRTEQRHAENSPYRFERDNCPPSDTLTNEGMGTPVAYTGMTWSGFRPSDDACVYGYLIPSNLFAVQALNSIALFAELMNDEALKTEATALSAEIHEGFERYGKVNHPDFGEIIAYETDGMGNYNLMDDANVPSLLGLPYLGLLDKDDPLYVRTRAFVLSKQNPYYYDGTTARGVGSPHTPAGFIWPIALCIQGMTSSDTDEIAGLVHMLVTTDAGCGCMHESFDPNAPEKFTREWFAWANSMFGELITRLWENGTLAEVLEKAYNI